MVARKAKDAAGSVAADAPSTNGWAISSTGVCPYCHRRANPVSALYAELKNEQATWTDAIFWMVVGAVAAVLIVWMPY